MINDLEKRISPVPISGIYEIVWSVTDCCDARCKYCYSDSKKRESHTLSIDDARVVADQLQQMEVKIIAFTGGDPFLNKDLFEIAELCRKKFPVLFLSSNGHWIDAEKARRVKQIGIDSVQISIDGEEKIHDELRGVQGSYKKALKAVRLLKDEGVDVAIAPTMTKHNLGSFDFLVDLAKQEGCDLSLKRVVLTGRGGKSDSLSISSSEYFELYRRADELNKRGELVVYMHCDPLRLLFREESAREKLRKNFEGIAGCMAGVGIMYIKSNLDVYPCSKLPIFCGNLREKSLVEIFDSSDVIKNLKNRTNVKGKCASCEYLNLCGGCRATAFENGDYLDEDKLCWYY